MDLQRPLVVFDLETTGTDKVDDRIVEFGAVKLHPDGVREQLVRRINPGRAIPVGATRIHGIRDVDVADCPTFAQVAEEVLGFFEGSDIGGFNVLDFDVPLLAAEMTRAGHQFPLSGARIVDGKTIFFLKERRTLSDAVRMYCGREHAGAHGAMADAAAAADVIFAQVERYPDLPREVDGLASLCSTPPAGYADRGRKFAWRDGIVVCAFGNKHKGRTLRAIVEQDRSYLQWILSNDFPDDTKFLVREALEGRYPIEPTGEASGEAAAAG